MKSVIMNGLLPAAGALFLVFATPSPAQVQTQTNTTNATPTHEEVVESGEVISVQGNDLFVKMSDGTMRDFPNIPETARVMVDGQQLGIHDLKPGMKLQRTTVTTTTPQVVTTVQTVTGKVWHVTPPLTVILRLENGENQAFKIPPGQKFMVDGRETDAWGLRKGMVVNATKVVETPVTSVARSTQVTGTMPAELPADKPVLIAVAAPAPEPTTTNTTETASSTAPTTTPALPATASDRPLIGLLGLLSISAAFGLTLLRKARS